ncbi:MAG: LemA family protein [Acidobacteria bacterium]|nr:LemA family protein [Acidobacteriota bacterium]
MSWWLILIIVVVVILLIVWIISLYNRLVRLRVETQQGWANIDVQLRRRYDLIPNLVETVKGYAEHERGVFQAVTEARTQAMDAKGVAETGQANTMLARALGGLFAVAEAYPDLKASSNFLQLQTELANVEEMLAAARRYYNSTVAQYNATQNTVPSNMVAKFGDFSEAEFFEEEDEAVRAAPQVSFEK